MMTEYFKLQFKMANRKLTDFGLHPIVGYLLLLIVFVGFSIYLFHRTGFAPYAYILVALFFTIKLSEIRRNDFLKMCFKSGSYRKLRIIENLIVVFPFVIFLIFKLQIYPIFVLVAISILFALGSVKTAYSITFPTPFYKRPFEFTVGFRNTFYLFIIAYLLTCIAIVVDNFNLGIFALVLVSLCTLSYYLKPENEYYVWSYSLTPLQFLGAKIKTAFIFSSFLCVPIFIVLSIFYFEYIRALLGFTLLGYLFLTAIILAKYAAYPNEIDLVRAIMICICFVFPPFLIVIIPFFANQSITKLKEILK